MTRDQRQAVWAFALVKPFGLLAAGMTTDAEARALSSFSARCLVVLPGARFQTKP